MPDPDGSTVSIRSYRLVTDKLDRRIFKVDRYRLPMPYGLPLRSLLYFAAAAGGVAVLSAIPVVGALLGLLPASLRWLALPGLIAFALTSFELDGRPPHLALAGWARYAVRPKYLAGLRPCPPPGAELAPVHEVIVAPSGEESTYRRGRVRGPATVSFRFPARIVAEGGRPRTPGTTKRSCPADRLSAAKRLRVLGAESDTPLVLGTELRVPEGREVVIGE